MSFGDTKTTEPSSSVTASLAVIFTVPLCTIPIVGASMALRASFSPCLDNVPSTMNSFSGGAYACVIPLLYSLCVLVNRQKSPFLDVNVNAFTESAVWFSPWGTKATFSTLSETAIHSMMPLPPSPPRGRRDFPRLRHTPPPCVSISGSFRRMS